MRQILFITLCVYALFAVQFLLFQLIGRWCVPNFLLLLVVFFTLYTSIRFGLFTAFLAGILHDSLSIMPLGTHILSFLACAYMTSILKKYMYHTSSRASRLFLVFSVSLVNLGILSCLHAMQTSLPIFDVLRIVWIPEILMTLLLTHTTFYQMKTCALKFSV